MATPKRKPTFTQRLATGIKSAGTFLYSAIAGPPKAGLVVDSILADGLSKEELHDFLNDHFPKADFPNYQIVIGRSDMRDSYQFQVPRLLDQEERNQLERKRWSSRLERMPSEEALSPEDAKKRRRGGGARG